MMEPVYDVDGIQIWHADCADVLPTIDPATVGLLLTDPPYGMNTTTDHKDRWKHTPSITASNTFAGIVGDDGPFDPTHLLVYKRVILWGAQWYASRLPDSGGWIVWEKRNGLQVATTLGEAELAWSNLGSGVRVFHHMWHGYFKDSEKRASLHPTQKPVALMRWILDKWTEPGDLILDPYMGSGPIARACADLGRRYIGIELVEEYVQAAINRLGQQALDLNQ